MDSTMSNSKDSCVPPYRIRSIGYGRSGRKASLPCWIIVLFILLSIMSVILGIVQTVLFLGIGGDVRRLIDIEQQQLSGKYPNRNGISSGSGSSGSNSGLIGGNSSLSTSKNDGAGNDENDISHSSDIGNNNRSQVLPATIQSIGNSRSVNNNPQAVVGNEDDNNDNDIKKSTIKNADTEAAILPINDDDSNAADDVSPSIHLWENSTKIPLWMKEYFIWHERERSLLDENNYEEKKFLIMTCMTGEKCGGTTDRLRPFPAFLRIAANTKRILMIMWTAPAPLEEFLVPPPSEFGGLDWRVPDWLQEKIISSERRSYKELTGIVKAANRPKRYVLTSLQDRNYGRAYYDEQRKEGEYDVLSIFHYMWPILFTPSKPIKDKIENIMNELQLVKGEYSATHLRALYGVKSRPLEKIEQMTTNALNCTSKIYSAANNNGPYFFTSDSSIAMQVALRYGQKNDVSIVIKEGNNKKSKSILPNSDKKASTNNIANTSTASTSLVRADENFTEANQVHLAFSNSTFHNVSDHYDTFIDLYLLAYSGCISIGEGGFGEMAYLINSSPSKETCNIRHMGKGSKKCREWYSGKDDDTLGGAKELDTAAAAAS